MQGRGKLRGGEVYAIIIIKITIEMLLYGEERRTDAKL
jgi:hypothetical protein